MSRGESKTSPRRLAAFERQVRALQLRAQGLTYQAVAQAVGMNSRQAAHKAVSLALARMPWTPSSYFEIELETCRVDALFAPTMRAAMTGDPLAITMALALMDCRAHLLANMR